MHNDYAKTIGEAPSLRGLTTARIFLTFSAIAVRPHITTLPAGHQPMHTLTTTSVMQHLFFYL